jgi:hypothetical protein
MFWNQIMAEGEGFEPPLPVKVKRFSRPPVSTAHTSLRTLKRVCLHYCTTAVMDFPLGALPRPAASGILGAVEIAGEDWQHDRI